MQLGKYDIHEVIGKGGFGTVYRATDRALGVERAVKIMHPALSQDVGFLERFRLEAHLAARFEHPHIVPVYDLDEINGVVFLAMKYLSGGSLKQRLANQGALPFPVAVKLLAQMASALDHAHQQGLIHRDVKPANILFETDELIRLSDFGFAKAMTGHDGSSSLTLSGGLIGTPLYMAPEIWRHKPVSPAVDQYSLACLFFECLTGQTLFAGESPADIMTRHVLDGPEFPASWPSGVPTSLTAVLEKALARDPAARFASCGQFAAAVAALAQPAARPVSRPAAAQPAVPAAPRDNQPTAQPETQPPIQPLIQTSTQTGSNPLPAPQSDPRPTASPPSAPVAVPPRAPQASAGFPRPAEPTPRKLPGWLIALIVLGGLGLLAICGVGAASLLDWPPGSSPTAVVVANPTRTPLPPATAIATVKPTTKPTNKPTATSNPLIPPSCTQIGQTWTSPVDGMNLVCVPAGDFLMGSTDGDGDAADDEKPQHRVYMDAYWMDQTEVSNAMFAAFVSATGYRTTAEEEGTGYAYTGSEWAWVEGANWQHPLGPGSDLNGKEDHPVVQVSWDDAAAYCAWAGRELPSEAEWEKAARGSSGQIYPWGNTFDCRLGNFDDETVVDSYVVQGGENCDGYPVTSPVGIFPSGASPYGVLDMAGNVWEWTADWYDENYYSSQTTWRNPAGPASGEYRVLRGGSWNSDPWSVRAALRVRYAPDGRFISLGFRCRLSP